MSAVDVKAAVASLHRVENRFLPTACDDLDARGHHRVASQLRGAVRSCREHLSNGRGLEQAMDDIDDIVAHATGKRESSGWDTEGDAKRSIVSRTKATVLAHRAAGDAAVPSGSHAESSLWHADRALMLGLPYELAQPCIELAKAVLKARGTAASESTTAVMPTSAWHEGGSIPSELRVARLHVNAITDFKHQVWKADVPVVITGAISHWPALARWPQLQWWLDHHPHRVVPLELGQKQGDKGWRECASSMSRFVMDYLVPSALSDNKSVECGLGEHSRPAAAVSADVRAPPPASRPVQAQDVPNDMSAEHTADHIAEGNERVAYLAQHRLFDQIPELLQDIECPALWSEGYEAVNAWMGTRGTVTPLHYDSMDNLLCQVAGSKYVRLYPHGEGTRLYVGAQDGAGQDRARSQGNFSAVDVEDPDLDVFPLFRDAQYIHTVLDPSDVLFIPARWFHYVRALTTSISVNFWF